MTFAGAGALHALEDAHRVLVFDADGVVRQAAPALLRAKLWPVTVDDAASATGMLDGSVRVALVDLSSERDAMALVGHLWCVEPELPVVAVCGAGDQQAKDTALSMGVFAVLVQPFAPDQLVTALKLAVDHGRTGAARFVRDVATTLTTIDAMISEAATPADALQPVLEQLIGLFDCERGSILIVDDEGDGATAALAAAVGFDGAVQQGARVPLAGSVAGRVAQSGIPQLLLRSLDAYPAFRDLPSDRRIEASVAVPIKAPDGVVQGVVNLARCTPGSLFTPRDADIAGVVAGMLGQAYAKASLEERQARLVDQMRAAEKLAYAGELAAGIAHDLANPIGCVRVNFDVLNELLVKIAPIAAASASLDEDGRALLADLPALVKDCKESLARATDIIQRTTKMVRLDATVESDFEIVPLERVAQETIRLLRGRVHPTKVDLHAEPGVHVRGNDTELGQVLANLLANASDACADRPEPRVRVALRTDADADAAVIVVEDNGCGIEPANLKKIFEPLFTTKPSGAGTGLGLGIVRRIVAAHLGAIAVESTPGEGTRFTLRFPLAAAPDARAHAAE